MPSPKSTPGDGHGAHRLQGPPVAAQRGRARHAPDPRPARRRVGEEDGAGRERAPVRLGHGDPLRAELRAEVDQVGLRVGLGVRDARLVLVHEPGVPDPALVLERVLQPPRLRVGEDPAGLGELRAPRGLLGLEVLDRPVRRDDEYPAQLGAPDEQALVLEVGHDDPRAVGRLDPDGRLELDQEALLEQAPAQVVRHLQAGRDREFGVELAQRAGRLLGVELHQALALGRVGAEDALRRAQRRPAQPFIRVDDAEVGQRLGRRVERARRVLLGHLARDEPHLAAGRQPADRLVGRVLDDRPRDQRALQHGADDEQEERRDREGQEPERRADAGAEVLDRAPAAARTAQQHGAGDQQEQRRQPDERRRPEEHRRPVPQRADEPQQDQRDERQRDRDGPRPAMHRPEL